MATLESAFSFLKKKWVPIGVGAVLLIALVVFFGSPKEEHTEETYRVTTQDVRDTVRLSGVVDAVSNIDLSFGVIGTVDSVLVSQGVEVQKGTVLARLELGVLEADRLQAQGNVLSAEARIAAANASVRKAEATISLVQAQNRGDFSSLKSARENLETVTAQQETLVQNAKNALLNNDLQIYPEVVVSALPAFVLSGSYKGDEEGSYNITISRSSQSNIGYAMNYSGIEDGSIYFIGFDIPQPLGKKGLFASFPSAGEGLNYQSSQWIIPVPNNRSATYQATLSAYTNAIQTSNTAITSARNALEKLEAEENSDGVSLASAEEEQALATLDEAKASRAQAESDLLTAKAQLARVNAQINDAIIRAPFDGTIARIDFEEGESVNAGQVGITLISNGDYELVMSAPELDVSKIVQGSPARLSLDVFGPDVSWEGEVSLIELVETERDGVPVYETHIVVLNPDQRMRVGMNARAEIIFQEKVGVLAIPTSFIIRDGGTSMVHIKVNESTVEQRVVELGLRGSNNFVEIVSGLSEGEVIVKPI